MDDISLIPFKHKHLPRLHEMLKSQEYAGTAHISTRTLPKIGYIALMNGQPIAAGFLRRLEPCFAQIDTLASNPFFGSLIRHAGISMVITALIQDAKELKLEGLIAFTNDSGVLSRAKDIGWHSVNEFVIAKKL